MAQLIDTIIYYIQNIFNIENNMHMYKFTLYILTL